MKSKLKVALLAKQVRPAQALARRLAEEFRRRNVEALFDNETAAALNLSRGFPRSRIPPDLRLVVTLGGDGTLLSAARAVSDRAEILGVNIGTLGFLTGVSGREVASLVEDAILGRFDRDVRQLLEISVHDGKRLRRSRVLNDAVLNRGALSRIARFTLRFDGQPFSSMRADGLIISSPTGSTAYNLSAGGPLLHPAVKGYLVTPICPHALTHRPIVLPASKTLEVSAEAGTPEGIYLTLDGQEGYSLPARSVLRARVSRRTVTLLRKPRHGYFTTLSEKLNWGA
ncbi:MAG: NAD(+)/NADH kinase [Thermoanaerobaculia bacterium]